MKSYKYCYLIYYSFKIGQGQIILYRTKPIDSELEVKSVREYIEDNNDFKNVAIMNIILLKKHFFSRKLPSVSTPN